MNLVPYIFGFVFLTGTIAKPNVGLIGGHDAKEGQFPYAVDVQECSVITGCSYTCTGSIIAPTWVIGTGQCYSSGHTYKVVAGILKLSEKKNDYMQTIAVNKVTVHENWHGEIGPYDIALFQLKEPLIYNDRVQPINLPANGQTFSGAVVASSWGQIGGDIIPEYPDNLQYMNISIMSGHDCKQRLDQLLHGQTNPFDDSNMVCTSDEEGGHSVCKGDAAVPLVQNNTLIGLGSWTVKPCGGKGIPSIYTKVASYLEWIVNHMT